MTAIDLGRAARAAPAQQPASYLTGGTAIRSWLLTTDHKRIALLYFASITVFFFVAARPQSASGSSCSRRAPTSSRPTPTTGCSPCMAW